MVDNFNIIIRCGTNICTGIEYIVSDRIFETLPTEEQKLWHSHAYEVRYIISFLFFIFIWKLN